jgi:hypothetical protein
MREDIDPQAEFQDVRGRFENGAGNAQLMQRQCQGQAANPAPRNQDASISRPNAALTVQAAGPWFVALVHRGIPSI